LNPKTSQRTKADLDTLLLIAGIPIFWLLSFLENGTIFIVGILILYFSVNLFEQFGYIRATKTQVNAELDAERKQKHIALVVSSASAASRLLSRYDPSWYPPPISDHLRAISAAYATFQRDLACANGESPINKPDSEVIRSSPTTRSFPEKWNYETTHKFCIPVWRIIGNLSICAELPLSQHKQYAAILTRYFSAKTGTERDLIEKQFPPLLATATNSMYDRFESFIRSGGKRVEFLENFSARLTALIPEYVAQTRTVIGTPPDGLPIFYDSLESRYRHTFLIGSSGAGKSTTIINLVAQDMHKGHGVIVMSPDQKLLRDLVPYIPERRLDDVICFDPNDTTSPIIGFNPFFFEPPNNFKPTDREYQRLKDSKAQETYAVLERTLQIDTDPTQRLLSHALYALTGRPNTTFSDLSRLIDPKERAFHMEIANDSRVDNVTRKFWATYATEGANAMVYRNLNDRLTILLRSSLFEVFSTQSLSFHRELNEHARIFLIDLSTFGSRISREARIAAQLLIPTIHEAFSRRNTIPEEANYIPYFMYIDEFQHFADMNEESIGDMAEQLRKFHLGLILTSLHASDLSTGLFDTIIGVMRTKICLTISAKDARLFASEMLIKRGGRDSYDPEALQTLNVGEAYVQTPPHKAAVFVKMPREPIGNLPKVSITFEQLKHRSKANFGAIVKPSASAAVDIDTRKEDVAEPTDEPPTQKQTPRQASRRRRNRFDEDEGDPLIEVS
jgi:hypothetical protein